MRLGGSKASPCIEAPAYVLIHDAAPAFCRSRFPIDRVLDCTRPRRRCHIQLSPVNDTVKRGSNGQIVETVDRRALWRAQTPQGFNFDAILAAHRSAVGGDFPDDAAVAESAGLTIRLVEGSGEENFKVHVTAEDMEDAAARNQLSRRLVLATPAPARASTFTPSDPGTMYGSAACECRTRGRSSVIPTPMSGCMHSLTPS